MSPFAKTVLGWYDVAHRQMPWRALPGETTPPYFVWLSEIMLQQTTVKAVIPYFSRFLTLWPRLEDLAAAELEEVLQAWAGLGYYARARNLHACAKVVTDQWGGRFPDCEKQLLALPGIGPYTAAAITTIAFDKPATVVDGNVERVMARYFAVQTPLPTAKPELKRLMRDVSPQKRPGDFAQAMMDLGATICTPKSPLCGSCPLAAKCRGKAENVQHELPRRLKKAAKPSRKGAAFVVADSDGRVLLRKRPKTGLLAQMLEVPGSDWTVAPRKPSWFEQAAPVQANWVQLRGSVDHVFTHFNLELTVFRADVARGIRIDDSARPFACRWVAQRDLAGQALPSVMRKVLTHALADDSTGR